MGIGRKPTKRVGIPNNRSMAARANTHLENYAISKGQHFDMSLRVDAPLFYFWYKQNGSIPCSCTAARKGFGVDIVVGGPNPTSFANIAEDIEGEDFQAPTQWSDSSAPSLNSFVKNLTKADNPQVPLPAGPTDELFGDTENDDDADPFDNVEDLPEIGNETTDFKDPFNLFSDKVIQCPVCLDSGFIDGWNLHGGLRTVFDTSNCFSFYCEGIGINAVANPTELASKQGGKVFWTFTPPRIWFDIVRINVYNGDVPLRADLYTWKWYNKDDNSDNGTVTRDSFNTLNDTGKQVRLVLTFTDAEPVIFTHAEIVFSFRSPYKAQIPEIVQGYEEEFLDWSVNLTVELPPTLQIKEGNYLTESKYKKVWKVSTLTRKVTAGGNTFGLTADLRALHNFEKKFVQLSLFKDYNTLSNVVPQSSYDDSPGVTVVDLDNFTWSGNDW